MVNFKSVNIEKLLFRVHAIKRMFERNVSVEEVRQIIEDGEVIEEYPQDKPYPSYLLLGWIEGVPLHVVMAKNEETNVGMVITVYRPDPKLWTEDFKRRRK